jgi:hypothetical protein
VKRDLIFLGICAFVVSNAWAFDVFESDARGSNEITAVSSRASEDYIRARLPDGSFQSETYAFGKGGCYGSPDRDPTLEEKTFDDVARAIALPLAGQKYYPSKDHKDTNFLIMVYWGTSTGPSNNPGLFRTHTLIEMQLTRNAMLLGYADDQRATIGLDRTPLARRRNDLFSDLGGNRYFVILMAYDFQLMRKQKKHKLVWETRFSLSEVGHDFGKALPMMADYAARYFGQDSHGLVRNLVPEGHVDIGAVKSLGDVPEK